MGDLWWKDRQKTYSPGTCLNVIRVIELGPRELFILAAVRWHLRILCWKDASVADR